MIDIHTHILYGVDDGADSLQMSVELLEEAERAGFSKVVLSSHYMENYFTVEASKREKVLSELYNTKTADVDLYLGNEVFISDKMVKLLKEKIIVPINNSRYVLFELPFNVKPINLCDVIFQLQMKDYIPILAHPERYSYFYDDLEFFEDLVSKGVLLQVNFGSFIGQYGNRAKIVAEKMLKANIVHFVASDAHRPETIYPEIPLIVKRLKDLVGEEKVDQLTRLNPMCVLDDMDIEIEDFYSMKYSFIEKVKMNSKK